MISLIRGWGNPLYAVGPSSSHSSQLLTQHPSWADLKAPVPGDLFPPRAVQPSWLINDLTAGIGCSPLGFPPAPHWDPNLHPSPPIPHPTTHPSICRWCPPEHLPTLALCFPLDEGPRHYHPLFPPWNILGENPAETGVFPCRCITLCPPGNCHEGLGDISTSLSPAASP